MGIVDELRDVVDAIGPSGFDGAQRSPRRAHRTRSECWCRVSSVRSEADHRGAVRARTGRPGAARAHALGAIDTTLRLPFVVPGDHTLELAGIDRDGQAFVVRLRAEITPGVGQLPATGSPPASRAWTALALVLAGVLMLWVRVTGATRRSRHDSTIHH